MSTSTDPEELYELLREEGLFEESAENLRFTDAFRQARDECRERVADLDDETFREQVEGYVDGTDFDVEEIDRRTLGDAIAVWETCDSLDQATSVHVALSLERTETADGDPNLPAGFVALSGEEIAPFTQSQPASVLYFWRKDCEPCAAVREDLSALRHDGAIPESVGLGAVYGPDNVELLREEYEVGAAPTVLFFSGSTVESRFVGNPGIDALRQEIALLVEDIET
ncbi:thioredoxin domain-containing protein [Halobellus clavatus]|uniref:Thioredoxin n=1 Tax=Halobellus clavatus TaxID=660517 RepID=A0A1H3FUB3_9EURY|nr:hypothetical protein [Halobellus clavatus]SDX94520.1 hypothetical protein SAMN04487946_104179 [Halobellus clavatus]